MSTIKTKNVALTTGLFYLLSYGLIGCKNRSENLTDKGTWVKLTEGEHKAGYIARNRQIYGFPEFSDSSAFNHHAPLKNADYSTFLVCPGISYAGAGYAKDKKHVYYPIYLICEDGDDYYCTYMVDYIVKGADPKTFKYLGDEYGVDCRNLYFAGKKIPWNQTLVDSLNNLPPSPPHDEDLNEFIYEYPDEE